jgi:hypothetical protein
VGQVGWDLPQVTQERGTLEAQIRTQQLAVFRENTVLGGRALAGLEE